MNVGIIVYSKTGNTLSVAERLRESLEQEGCSVQVERFSAETEGPQSNKVVRLTANPDPSGYDLLIFGAPVQAFSLDPAMKLYLSGLAKQKQRPTLCFVTQHFPKPWMGGKQATRQMMQLLSDKGLTAKSLGVANWTSKQREALIATITETCRQAVALEQ
ncbi:MAG: flavodoxin family protein [Clostridiales bacterium]|nr:flavodoxin family protein [Clostridiales bacterium]